MEEKTKQGGDKGGELRKTKVRITITCRNVGSIEKVAQ